MNSMGQPFAHGGNTTSPNASPLCLVPAIHVHVHSRQNMKVNVVCIYTIILMYDIEGVASLADRDQSGLSFAGTLAGRRILESAP